MDLDAVREQATTLEPRAFAALHPDPVLLIFAGHRGSNRRVDTRMDHVSEIKRAKQEITSTNKLRALIPAANDGRSLKDVTLVPIAKSGRNPFADMITIGRAPNNDVILDYEGVSKVHAIARRTSTGWELTDQRSTNGTFVNGNRLDPGATTRLPDGVSLGFGPDTACRFHTPEGLQTWLRSRPAS